MTLRWVERKAESKNYLKGMKILGENTLSSSLAWKYFI